LAAVKAVLKLLGVTAMLARLEEAQNARDNRVREWIVFMNTNVSSTVSLKF